MKRTASALVLLLTASLGLWCAACGEPAASDPAGDGGAAGSGRDGGEDAWIRRRPGPDLSIVLVGNQRGKLKPCGCSEPQLGGLERLAAFVEVARRRAQSNLAALSMGWTLKDTGEPQLETKASLYRAALDLMGFDALLLGTTDLAVPALAQPFLDGRGCDLSVPPANAPIAWSGPLARAADTEPLATIEVAGLTVRALSILDAEAHARLGGVVEAVLGPKGALQLLTPLPEALWIVSTDATPATIEELREAMARLGPTLILDLAGAVGATVIENVPLEAGPHVVTLADLGREAGIIDLDRRSDAEGGGWLVSYHVVPLEPGMERWPSDLRDRVTELFDVYRAEVRERNYLARFQTYPMPGDVKYVGSSRCARCHPGIYEDWIRTPHARALRTLEATGYHWDPECVRCHVVGFQRLGEGRWGRVGGGFVDPRRSPNLGGVGCECCHGPGEAHAESPYDGSLWGPRGPNRRHPGRKGCQACHDVENSFGFVEGYEERFLPQVDHRDVPGDRRIVDPEGR